VVVSVGSDVVLRVADDGKGMDPSAPESGLENMRERARKHGGSFSVDSTPGQGTAVTWAVPLSGPVS
jgi:signal transduction histidine kinase